LLRSKHEMIARLRERERGRNSNIEVSTLARSKKQLLILR